MTDSDNRPAPQLVAEEFLHSMIQPLIPRDPGGVAIRVKGTATSQEITLFCTPANMGCIIGKNGQMVSALRQLVKCFGWYLNVPGQARSDIHTVPIDPPPSVRELVLGWLDARYGPEAYKNVNAYEDREWNVFVHPDFYEHDDHAALEAWAFGAARAQQDFLKVRLKPGGVIAAT